MCSYNNILTKRKHQFHARSQKSGSKLLAPTVQKNILFDKILLNQGLFRLSSLLYKRNAISRWIMYPKNPVCLCV